jgi:hypothetical protein
MNYAYAANKNKLMAAQQARHVTGPNAAKRLESTCQGGAVHARKAPFSVKLSLI